MAGAEPREVVRTALEALGRYRLRTALSVLGVVLGVASVIAMLSVSEGAAREALAQVDALGLDNIAVRTRPMPGVGAFRPLLAGDVAQLASTLPGIRTSTPLIERRSAVQASAESSPAPVLGVRPAYFSLTRASVRRGRPLTELDETTAARVVVLGASLSRRLFRFQDPVGRPLRVGDAYMTVVGVLDARGERRTTGSTLAWHDADQSAFVPLSTLSGRQTANAVDLPVDEAWFALTRGDEAAVLAPAFAHALARLPGGRDVDLVVPRELLAERQQTERTFAVVIGSVAVLALLVGGIGIMNIMLTSVVERTREIGVRRMAGATRRDVAQQFLIEAVLMTALGGLAGIVVGATVSVGITRFAAWRTYVSLDAVVLAFVISCAVGVLFGFYPAVQAARLEPVDAMRHE